MLDKEFSQTLDGMYDITSFWAIEYWKNLCGVLSSFLRLTKQENNLDLEKLMERDDRNHLCRSRIAALFHILDALSDKHGIEQESVLEVAQAKGIFEDNFALDDLPESAQDYYHATLDLMDSMISGAIIKDQTVSYFGVMSS